MEWKTVKLGDITIGGKGSYGIGAPAVDFNPLKYTYLRITDINDDGTINYAGLKSVDDPEAYKYILKPNDIVFARTGATTGRTYFYLPQDGTFVYAGFLIKFSIDPKKANPRLLKYITHSQEYYDWVRSFDTGGTRGNINAKTFADMPLCLPDRASQDKIVSILSSLDDKIENNNRINRNLEAQAQALFKSWFVDFEPFGGTMPEDWKFDDISNIPHVLETGRRPKGGAVESGVPSIGAEHIKGMGTYDYSKTKYITEEYARSMKAGKIKGYELLIYKDGGKPGYFIPNFTIYGEGYPFDECYINEHVLKLDFPDKAFNIFCYFYFQEPEVMTYLNAQGGKAAIPGINKSDIENINILSQENEAVKQFGDIVMPYFTTILRNLKENQRLAALRDTLLPKLMKGEIAV